MALKIIGAGFGRTGTLSLKAALDQLGFGPCHHMTEVIADIERQGPIWNDVATGKERDWEKVFAGYSAAVDWPSAHYYSELASAFPDAKVILTVRDPQTWYASMNDTILGNAPPELDEARLDELVTLPMWFALEIVMRKTFQLDVSQANVIATFERHNAEVRHTIAKNRLLEFDVKQGWEPLCAFLGVPVPDAPFPRVNDREQFKQHAKGLGDAFRR